MRGHFGTVASLPVACAVAQGGVLQSDFDAGLDGWTISNAIGVQWQSSGGNPGGYAHIDNSEGQIAYMFAPLAFLGDLSAYNGGLLSFDAIQLDSGGTPWDDFENFGRVRIISGAIVATRDLVPGNTGPASSWTTYSAALVAADWGMGDAEWQSLLSNVTQVSLSVEGLFGPEVNGVDNFTIAPAPGAIGMLGLALASTARRRRHG